MPNHPVALGIINRLGRPVTGTSANRSGRQDLLNLEAVTTELGEDVDYIVQSGPQPKGTPSTVVDLTTEVPTLLRQGTLLMDELLREIG
jgi:L-threonylcarbamoyladenylate synthase